jgi:DnaJ like chaperone protein
MWQRMFSDAALAAIGGPLGALARAAIDGVSEGLRLVSRRDPTQEAAFTVAMIVLGAKMAKVDGTVSAPEINAFREVFQVPEAALERVGRIFDRAREDADGYLPYAQQVALLFLDRPEVLEQILVGLFHIAKADGPLHAQEMEYLAAVAAAFGIEEARFERISLAQVMDDGVDPYAVLGVAADADHPEVRRAYMDLVRRHHPDRLSGAGLPAEFVAQAEARLAAVNVAYRQIAKARGLAQ